MLVVQMPSEPSVIRFYVALLAAMGAPLRPRPRLLWEENKVSSNYRTLQRSNSCKNPFKTMTYFNSAICKRFVGMEAGIIKVSS